MLFSKSYYGSIAIWLTVRFWLKLCENVLEQVSRSKPERKSRSYANFRSTD